MKITNDELNTLESLVKEIKSRDIKPIRQSDNSYNTTVYHNDMEFSVKYRFYKGNTPVFYTANGDGHPGDPSEIDIIGIKTNDDLTTMLDLFDKKEPASNIIDEFYLEIETKIIEQHEKD